MKIIFLNRYQFTAKRGAETFIFELADRLSRNHQVDIIAKINYWELLKKDFDIIIPTNGRWQVFIVRLLSIIKGAKMIVSGQSGLGADDKLNLLAFPDMFVGLTKHQTAWANKFNPFIKTSTIPNGVDLDKFTTQKPVKDVVIAVGAFTKEKGHEYTVNAVSKISKLKLLIAGDSGDQKEFLVSLARKKLPGRFQFISTEHNLMPTVYSKGGVFVYPTVIWESFGVAMVEAMASGLPVVATDDPIRREIVGKAGIFVTPQNTEEYAHAIETALSRDWGDIPRKQAEKFSWDFVSNQYEELFKTLLNKK